MLLHETNGIPPKAKSSVARIITFADGTGATFGHNAALGAFSMAAADVQNAHGGSFTGGSSNPTFVYSSDGPRRMFFNPDGTAITPGDLTFGANGSAALNKPDFTAADGVPPGAPGWDNFFGTSAAAAHAGAVAALVLQAVPGTSLAQMRAVLTASALDIEGSGWDINSGAGIIMARGAVTTALSLTTVNARFLMSVAPPVGSGSAQSLTVTYNAPGGYKTLDVVNVLINNVLDGR